MPLTVPSALWKRLRAALREHGIRGTARIAFYRAVDYLPARRADTANRTFDRDYNVETDTVVWLADLHDLGANREHGNRYQPSPATRVPGILRRLRIQPPRYTFIDLGSGKGRVILVAAQFPFRAVVGVEFSSELHAAAIENIRRYTGPIAVPPQSLHLDAAHYRFPPGNLVVFLFNPFHGPVLKRVLENLRPCADSSDVVVVYWNPVYRQALDGQPWLRAIRTDPGSYSVYRSIPPARRRP